MFVVVALVIGGATYDLVTSASAKDQQVQASELRGELAQFLLSIREADGSTLLENPAEFSDASRAVSIVSLRRFPFIYWLNAENAKRFKAVDIAWESPRSCQVEFSESSTEKPASSGIQVCLAVVPSDPTGRYVYFSLKYPSAKIIHRHVAGQSVGASDRVEFSFAGTRLTALTLIFEAPPLALARYPSKMARFADVHELTGFLGTDTTRPTKLVVGQAFERDDEDSKGSAKHFITILGRIDSAMLSANPPDPFTWPDPNLKALKIGVRVFAHDEGDAPKAIFEIPSGAKGTPLVSLSQAYLAAVPSRARLEVTTIRDTTLRTIWKSDDVGAAQLPRLHGLWQQVADWWAGKAIASTTSSPTVAVRQVITVPGIPSSTATLTATRIALPDIATRAFTWLTVAALLVALLASDWAVYLFRLLRLRGTAFSMVVHHTNEGNLDRYVGREREIGTLARIFDLLIRRGRTRSTNTLKRNRRKANDLRIAEAQIVNRKTILEAIGHEIRAPLQSLLTLSRDDAEAKQYLERIRRAVNALYDATSVETGLKSGDIVVAQHDLAAFLQRLAMNLAAGGKPVTYSGPTGGTLADFDPIQLEQILDNIIDNAMRYRIGDTNIELRLLIDEQGAELTVFNQGPKIPDSDLERIFGLGVSDSESGENTGLGLFASRSYALAMGITLGAININNGVAFKLQFPSSTTKERD